MIKSVRKKRERERSKRRDDLPISEEKRKKYR
jgi:hypothetical protein